MQDPFQAVFLLYVFISANYIGDLYPCRLQSLLTNSRLVKHAVGLMSMCIVVSSIAAKKKSQRILHWFAEVTMLYMTFVISTKADGRFAILAIVLMALREALRLQREDAATFHNTNFDDFTLDHGDDIDKGLKMSIVVTIILGLVVNIIVQLNEKATSFKWTDFITGGCRVS